MNSISEIIKRVGDVTVEQFMELALFHPEYGYYQANVTLGKEGDFVTAPSISSIFSEMIAIYLTNFIYINNLSGITLVECGPGNGQMMLDMLATLKKLRKGSVLQRIKSIAMLETSPRLMEIQRKKLFDTPIAMDWYRSVDDISSDGPLIFLGNEFWDSIPIKQYVSFDSQWYERLISLNKEEELFFSCNTKMNYANISKGIDAVMKNGQQAKDGEIIEIPRMGLNLMEQISSMIKKNSGMGLFLDYGYDVAPRSYNSTIQSIQGHQPVNPLLNPGHSDITHLVNFPLLSQTAQECGLKHLIKTQRNLLLACGIEERVARLKNKLDAATTKTLLLSVERLISPKKMGELFKAIIFHSPDCRL